MLTAIHVITRCPEIVLQRSFAGESGARAAAAAACSNKSAIAFRVEGVGHTSAFQHHSLERVHPEEYGKYGVPHVAPDGREIFLLRRRVPGGEESDVTCIYDTSGPADRAARFIFHWADRFTYVRRVSISWSNFTVRGDAPFNPRLIP